MGGDRLHGEHAWHRSTGITGFLMLLMTVLCFWGCNASSDDTENTDEYNEMVASYGSPYGVADLYGYDYTKDEDDMVGTYILLKDTLHAVDADAHEITFQNSENSTVVCTFDDDIDLTTLDELNADAYTVTVKGICRFDDDGVPYLENCDWWYIHS